jgi:hypothetical protein
VCIGFAVENDGVVDASHLFAAGAFLTVGASALIFEMLLDTDEVETVTTG